MKIIGSHNSVTGEKPADWLAKLFPVFCQCQTKSLTQQVDAGVRCFDIRVALNDCGSWVYPHGKAKYRLFSEHTCCRADKNFKWKSYGPVSLLWEYFSALKTDGNDRLYVRLILENPSNNGRSAFISLCRTLEEQYPEILFFEGRDKHTWEKLYTFKHESEVPEMTEYHASVSGKGLYSVTPCLFWHKYGKDYKLKDGINLIDFV